MQRVASQTKNPVRRSGRDRSRSDEQRVLAVGEEFLAAEESEGRQSGTR